MISVLICSINPGYLSDINKSIAETIGVPYEILSKDNRGSKDGICKVYNQLAASAKYNILCFVHEDVFFHTNNWGRILINYFEENAAIGCVGVAGGRYKTKAPSHWRPLVKEFDKYDYSYLIQHYKNSEKKEVDGWQDKTKKIISVVFLDGVFLAMNKNANLVFDESVEGFHGYDISISLDAIRKGLKNYASREILIEHLSGGSFNDKWIRAIHQFHLQNAKYFPLSADENKTTDADLETSTLKRFIELALMNRQYRIAFYWWMKLFMEKPFLKEHIYFSKVLFRNMLHKPAMN